MMTVCAACAQKNVPQYLTVDEAASLLRVGKMTIYRLVEQGALKSARIGRQIRIDSTAFDAYVKTASA